MTINRKVTGTAASFPVGVSAGIALSLGATMCLAAFEAWLTLTGRVEESVVGYLSMANLLVSSFAGALLSAGWIKRRRMMVCLVTGTVYYLTLLGCTALFFGGNYQGVGVGGVVILAGSCVAGLLGLRRKEGHIKGFKKYRSR